MPKKRSNIGVDLMGCETRPIDIANAILSVLDDIPNLYSVTFFCSPNTLPDLSAQSRVIIHETDEVIFMDDNPLIAVRQKRRSSLSTAMEMLRTQEIDALISACNTGALIVSANLFLPKLRGIDRAALLTLLPTLHSSIAILDVGANPTVKAAQLLDYAAMGIAYQKTRNIPSPQVGLLNIGNEEEKGTPEIRLAYQLLRQHQPLFIGNIEPRDLFSNHRVVDVVVTDGFTGNVLLKTAEGVATLLLEELEKDHTIQGDLALLRKKLHYAEYPGALVVGVEGIVMKCHGEGHAAAFRESYKAVVELLEKNFLAHLKSELTNVVRHKNSIMVT